MIDLLKIAALGALGMMTVKSVKWMARARERKSRNQTEWDRMCARLETEKIRGYKSYRKQLRKIKAARAAKKGRP